jgi:LPXTG-motif cell wall-anchored protein
MVKRLLLVAGLTVGLLLGTGSAGAQQYPPEPFFLAVSDSTVVPGQTITVTGHETPGATSVTFTFFSVAQSLGSTTPDANGDFSASVTIPSDATLGNHTITGTDNTGREVSASVTVVAAGEGDDDDEAVAAAPGAAAPGAEAGALPRTGDDSLPLLRVGALLLALGGVLVLLTRRRREAAAQA